MKLKMSKQKKTLIWECSRQPSSSTHMTQALGEGAALHWPPPECPSFLALLIGPRGDHDPEQLIQRYKMCPDVKQMSWLGNMNKELQ